MTRLKATRSGARSDHAPDRVRPAGLETAAAARPWRMWAVRVMFLLLVALDIAYLVRAFQYSFGSLGRPGAGFVPVIAGTLTLIGLLAVGITRPGRSDGAAESRPVERMAVLKAVAVFVVAATFVCLNGWLANFPEIGSFVGLAAVALAVMLAMGERLWLALATAVVLSVCAYYVFEVALDVPLGHGSGL